MEERKEGGRIWSIVVKPDETIVLGRWAYNNKVPVSSGNRYYVPGIRRVDSFLRISFDLPSAPTIPAYGFLALTSE